MSESAIQRQLEEIGDRSPESAESLSLRRSALERFQTLGLPGRRVESWRYTDLSPLAKKDFRFVSAPPAGTTLERVEALVAGLRLTDAAPRCVFVDGHLIDYLSRIDDDSGLVIESQAIAPADEATETALVALNTAFASESRVVRVQGSSETTLEVLFVGTGQMIAPQVRLRIELAAGAKATVIQRYIDLPGTGETWLNQVTDIDQADNSELSLHRLQSHQAEQIHTTLNRVQLAEGAKFISGNAELGGAIVRNEFEIKLNGRDAEAQVYGISLTRDRQHSDMRIAADHRAPYTTSRQDFRAIVDDASRTVFNGKVTVQEKAQHIDARQRNDNLLLSAKAEVDTKPELEIYADQVVCSHGATVGELSEEQLFYLRARGIDEQTAKAMLTTAFANTIVDRFEPEHFREQVRVAVADKLPRQLVAPANSD